MNVTLIGYRGTGKSTVARLVAEQLGWSCVDADKELEVKAGRSIREIFDAEGEAGFRDREASVIRELTARDRVVIAAGGGAILRAENRAAIKQAGMTVWLVASPTVIDGRVAADPTTAGRRPRLTQSGGVAEIRTLLAEREPHYRACADLVIETDEHSPEETADLIVGAVSRFRPSARTE